MYSPMGLLTFSYGRHSPWNNRDGDLACNISYGGFVSGGNHGIEWTSGGSSPWSNGYKFGRVVIPDGSFYHDYIVYENSCGYPLREPISTAVRTR